MGFNLIIEPDQEDAEAAVVLVDGLIDGRNRRFLLDTGAGMTIVNLEFVNKHPDLFQNAGRSVGIDATGAELETPMFLMEAPRIGDHVFPPLKVAGVDLSHVNTTIDIPMDFILGYNAFSKANWLFDFPEKKWKISTML